MRVILFLMLFAACAVANKHDNRHTKLPFVADAVGNSLPPPSNVPATVGSPVNLLTPDRYEFYTFDESGELVKRLMTLEEIQAIVAAGEEAEGLVTLANDNQPTVPFDVHQPSLTKVHSVVTNVQNVLKAQMEAHKNRPQIQPTLDTPDVSDSWSLILPSIFGNTGVDIVLDKTSGSVTPPETETIEENNENDEDSLSKEGNHQVLGSFTTTVDEKNVATEIPLQDDEIQTISTAKVTTTTTSTTTTTTTAKPTITTPKPTTTTAKPTTTTPKPTTTTPKPTTTTPKPTTTTPKPTSITLKPTTPPPKFTTTTTEPITTTKVATKTTRRPIFNTKRPLPSTRVTTAHLLQNITTTKPRATITTIQPTTPKPVIRTTSQTTIVKPESTTKKHFSTSIDTEDIKVQVQVNSNAASSTERNDIEFEKISTFIPVSTVKYISERTTHKPAVYTKLPIVSTSTTIRKHVTSTTKAPTTQATKVQQLVTTFKPMVSTFASSTVRNPSDEKVNATTITTQSVSPSTTVSSTEFLSADKVNLPSIMDDNTNGNDSDPLPLFDVALSISQIASDLGNNYQPIPTTNNLLENNNESQVDLESKENIDIDIPSSTGNETELQKSDIINKTDDNFIKISTIDPHDNSKGEKPSKIPTENITDTKKVLEKETSDTKNNNIIVDSVQKLEFTSTTVTTESTTIDPVLSESMGDLLSQVANQSPTIVDPKDKQEEKSTTLEEIVTPTTTENSKDVETTSQISLKVKKDTSTTTEKSVEIASEKQPAVTDGTSVTKNYLDMQTENPEKKSTVTTPKPSIPASTKTDLNLKTEKPEKERIEPIPKPNDNRTPAHNKTDLINRNSASIIKNDSNVNKLQDVNKVSAFGITKIKEKIEKPEIPVLKNDNKTSKPAHKIEYKAETTTKLSDIDVSEKNITLNKISQSKINEINLKDKINGINKNSKHPELLPKVDDFRKKIQKVNIDDEELISLRNNSWKLIPTLSPPKVNEIPKDKVKSDDQHNHGINDNKDVVLEFSNENQGLEVTTKDLDEDIAKFSELSNELAFRYWSIIVDDIDKRRSFVFSPYSTFSMLAMIFMGARGATSGEMNEILKLDDMFTFNPHFTLKNISDSIETTPQSGVAVSAFTRELYSDRNKGKILTFYKERAHHFYDGHVEEINFKLISDIIRRRTNLLVKRYTWGKMPEFMKTNNIVMQPPLAAFTANIFQTDCSGTSVDGRDGEMYFVVSPNVRQRRLVPVPAVVYKKGFFAGYDPVLDVTVAALGNTNTIVSTLFLMPGQQGNVVHADDLEKLEQRLLESIPATPTWNRVLRSLLPRTGLELQIPRFSHKSTFNASSTLKKMGLKDLFDGEHADLGGLNGPSKDLYLSDMVQLNTFVTCGEGGVGEQHHIEEYPETLTVSQRRRARWLNDWDEPRDYQRAFHDPHDISDAMHLPLHLRPRQARLPARSSQPARLKFDRPFLYFVRHNPSGMILYFGRYNPRLLP